MVKPREHGGYDAWGVLLPTGRIREYDSEDRCRAYIERMRGMDIVTPGGTELTLDELHLVHRYIPEWTIVDEN